MSVAVKCLIVIFILLLPNSCSDERYLINSETNDSDVALRKMLVGEWQFGSNISVFRNDDTYLDSSYAYRPTRVERELDSSNVCPDSSKSGSVLIGVVYGKYEVKDRILRLQPIDYLVDCYPLNPWGAYLYYDHFVELSGDSLSLTEFHSWKRTVSNKNDIWGRFSGIIWGSWESNYWVWAYHENLPTSGAPQLVKETITFFQDSTIFHDKIVGLPYSGEVWRLSFTFVPPLLNIVIGYREFYVTFDRNTMHWLDTKFTYHYTRLHR